MSEPHGTRPGALRHLPTAAVLAALAAVGVWGHRNGWKAPAFAGLLGGGAAAPVDDWCPEHGVPESKCIACRPELAGQDPADWCREHGLPESKCTACHPELLQGGAARDWCAEHGLPESGCTICHPEIAAKGEVPPAASGAEVLPEPGAAPAPDPEACTTHLLRVQFASPEAVRKSGIAVEAAAKRPFTVGVDATGEVEYDGGRLARVPARAAGVVARVLKEPGQGVRRGEVLALLDAAEAGRARSAILRAVADRERARALLELARESAKEGFRTRSEVREAEAAEREAGIALLDSLQAAANLGLPAAAADLEGLPPEALAEKVRLLGIPQEAAGPAGGGGGAASANLLPVTAPLDGVVVSREAVPGEAAEAGSPLFTVADLSWMWVCLDVRQEDVALVRVGQRAAFHPDGSGEEAVKGRVAWIATGADEATRTVRVRVQVENPGGRLRARTFGRGRIAVRVEAEAIAVPDGAIQWDGCCPVVFVRQSPEVFRPRKVRTGARAGGFTEVLAGLLPGEAVAVEGSHVLKSEILRGRLGAGCCD